MVVYSNCQCSYAFCFSLNLFKISLWPSAGKELTSLVKACAVLLYAVLIVCVLFPFCVWDRMWNSIVSIPDQCH